MSEHDRIEHVLRSLAQHPPAPPPPVASIASNARRRRSRAKLRNAVAVLSVIALAGLVVFASDRSEPPAIVDTVGVPEADPDEAAPDDTIRPDLVAEPSSGLVPDQEVRLVLADDTGSAITATQCASEAADEAVTDPRQWCSISVHRLRSRAGVPTLELPVSRVLDTPNGRVDCAGRPGRCVIAATQGGSVPFQADTLTTPITFRDDLPPLDEPAIELVDGESTVASGNTVTVEGRGFGSAANGPVSVMLCPGHGEEAGDDLTCDLVRGATADVRADGTFEATLVVAHEILTYAADGWERCEPCSVVARQAPLAVSVPISITDTGRPGRPSVRIEEPGPYEPGQVVTLLGEGFQDAEGLGIGGCAQLGSEVPLCSYPPEGFDIGIQPDGTFRERFPLPDEDDRLGAPGQCADVEAGCALAWIPADGAPAAFVTPFVLRARSAE